MYSIEFAQPGDETAIHHIIEVLAEYEHAADEVIATPEMLATWLFERDLCECLIAKAGGGEVVGIALYFYTYSTWLGRRGIHLEDLCVLPEWRGQGIGTALLKRLAQVAVERDCGRLEWDCLDWNEPSLEFYRKLGAQELGEWVGLRLSGESLHTLASS